MGSILDPGTGSSSKNQPTWPRSRSSAATSRLVPVKGDEEGYDPGALERALKEHQPKLIYLVSTFHNPTGITYSLERRKKEAELAAKYDC